MGRSTHKRNKENLKTYRKKYNIHKTKTRKRRKRKRHTRRSKQMRDIGKGSPELNQELKFLFGVSPPKDDGVLLGYDGEEILPIEQFKIDNTRFQLNELRTDMIGWKREKKHHKYGAEVGWEYVPDPNNLPKNNYLLYLLEMMPENISNTPRSGWKTADGVGLDQEARAILKGRDLGTKSGENFWVDERLLGENWKGLFDSVSDKDRPVRMTMPELPDR